jgi:hypothetical protein
MAKVIGYSERGLVYSLINDISQDDVLIESFLKKIFEISDFPSVIHPKDIVIYIEPSLSEFGDPDLIITFKDGGVSKICFIEAKYNVKIRTELNKFVTNISLNYKDVSDGFPSNLFSQILLKYFFTKAKKRIDIKQKNKTNNVKIIFDSFVGFDGLNNLKNRRSAGTKQTVLELIKKINWRKSEDYYIGLVRGKSNSMKQILNDFLNLDLINKIKGRVSLIGWDDIDQIENQLSEKNYSFKMFDATKKFNSDYKNKDYND